MITMTKTAAFLLGVIATFRAGAAEGQGPLVRDAGAVRLLTVGNSFSGNATRFLAGLAAAADRKLEHRPIIVSGASLQLHAEKAQAHERDPLGKEGLYAGGRSLKQELLDGPWDFVTIQQASLKSHDVATFRPYAAWLRDYIARHAPGAEVLIHQTWAYRCDDPRFTNPPAKPGDPPTQEAMNRGISGAYGAVARELGLRLIPVGDAFFLADRHSVWGFTPDTAFDFTSARHPALPRQLHSLHTGWQWKKRKDGTMALSMDGHHAGTAGQYLGGCVWFEVIFGASVVGNAFVPPGIEPDFARFLQETAHRAVVSAGAASRIPAGAGASVP